MSAEEFQWLPEYDVLLDKVASTDIVDSDWDVLRNAIKYKITENIAAFLADKSRPPPPPTFQPQTTASGGLKLPPFPPRKQQRAMHSTPIPVSYMTEEQANEMKGFIFAQLDEFDSNPPFTIQRVCELCIHPQQHYSSVGKYLRAVEKSLLVTSTWDTFPPLSEVDSDPNGRSVFSLGSTRQSAPSTPLFSPIPFLHEDARRSKSRSPPPSPLALAPSPAIGGEPSEPRALGLVDELDEPSPGHMSDHPTALTSNMTSTSPSRPLLGSLDERFVKSEEAATDEAASDDMVVDEDKENKS
ncbi:putative PPP4R2 [Lyophyllum shimeji]|uniref:PPP4R2 n=1 Tax=Lyophyllum shimeji TaxID=47721 RepID=A0A9P3PG55_LYOSH|nr:putative PPP4R2 [Lyophyllum shimeji]